MLNANDDETGISLKRLRSVVAAGTRPIVIWVGAGSSKWLGYPEWKDLTLQLRRNFFRAVGGFDNERALELINKENYPAIFQMCRDLDSARYHRFLADAFLPRVTTDLYQGFLSALRKVSPLFVLTTNVDEALESQMPASVTVQKSDFSRCIDLLHSATREDVFQGIQIGCVLYD